MGKILHRSIKYFLRSEKNGGFRFLALSMLKFVLIFVYFSDLHFWEMASPFLSHFLIFF